jgi:flagellar biosynthesis protein FlhG
MTSFPTTPASAGRHTGRLDDQAQQLRLLARGKTRSARVIAVVSGKGGVGKSNIAANLAICLADAQQRVILLDADLGLANADLILGVRPRANLADVIDGRGTLSEILIDLPGGASLVPGGSGLSQLADLPEFKRHRLMQIVEELESRADLLVVDCGAGIGRNVTGLAAGADTVLVVLTPEPTALADAYATIKVITGLGAFGRIGVVVNMARTRDEASRTAARLGDVAQKFLGAQVLDFGYVLVDDHVRQAVCRRTPLLLSAPRSPAALCIMAIASKLTAPATSPDDSSGFLQRVIRLFV